MTRTHREWTCMINGIHSARPIHRKCSPSKMAGFTLLLFVSIVLVTVPAMAQASHDEVSELREEVAELRALVAQLINEREAQGASAEPLERLPSQASGDDEDQQRANSVPQAAARQPIGRFPDDAFVTAGSFDRSISVPGTDGAIRIGGALQVDANFDTDHQGFQQIGTPPTIPLDGTVDDGDEQFAIHARHTRVNFDYRAPTDLGEFRTFVEFDFFGDGDEFTNDYDLRLRHAAAELGPWKLGQFWSGFVDVFSFPETADPGGPLSAPVLRNPGIYYVRGEQQGSNWGIGIENPAGDLGGNTDLIASESAPNVVAFAKLQRDWGYLRLAGLGVQLESDTDQEFTGGIHLSGRLNTPFTGSEQNNIAFAAQAGSGFVHYYSSFVGELDGVISDDGTIEPTDIIGAYFGYQHFWTDRWRSTVTGSFFDLGLPQGANPLAHSNSERVSGNLFYTPTEGVTLGLEGIYNTLETFDGSEGDGFRIEFVGRFDF
ncbi:MAG: DcaP family trimeric outer membrane transporter [Pseudomonadota bacterium]